MQSFKPLGAPGLGGGDGAQADPPDPAKLPQDDILGITAVLLTCLYGDKVRPSPCFRRRPPAALLSAAVRKILFFLGVKLWYFLARLA